MKRRYDFLPKTEIRKARNILLLARLSQTFLLPFPLFFSSSLFPLLSLSLFPPSLRSVGHMLTVKVPKTSSLSFGNQAVVAGTTCSLSCLLTPVYSTSISLLPSLSSLSFMRFLSLFPLLASLPSSPILFPFLCPSRPLHSARSLELSAQGESSRLQLKVNCRHCDFDARGHCNFNVTVSNSMLRQ